MLLACDGIMAAQAIIQNGSRQNGTNHRLNVSRQNRSRRNGNDSYDHRPLQYCIKLSQLGLSTAYMEIKDKYLFLRKLMSLPLLSQEHILPAFTD